ncbi:Signal transduction histidine kinase [Streptomyces sp. SceaMP-e96]|uniref:sensor histidine kinase n=1 Tax=Streptomyces TaxID=1883 RepID=UPI000823B508|nr:MULTISPECIES: histidine kinase [unclassified Streptomyces]SCK06883.1 Signal transduction histidine kinase [Streptomyces sp. SceaMP-e96]
MSPEVAGPATAPAPLPDRAPPGPGPLFRLPGLPSWWRPWGATALDVLIAMGCAWFDAQFRTTFLEEQLHSPLPQGWAIGLTVVGALLLVLRRRFPAVVTAAITCGLLLGTGSVLATVVAYYSLARHTPRVRTVFVAAPVGLLLVLGVAVLHLRQYAPHHGTEVTREPVLIALVALTGVVVPVLTGLYPRAPRQPWWWEHRSAMLFDVLLVLLFPLANPVALVSGLNGPADDPLLVPAPVLVLLVMVQGVALIWRRRYPDALAAVAVILIPLVLPSFSILPVSLYALAKYGASRRNLLLGSGAAAVVLVAWTAVATEFEAEQFIPYSIFLVVPSVVVPVLFGMYRGAKRSLMVTLQDRADRLEREQHLLASQARMEERTRIAREMHDVVSHRVSLMVVHAGALEAGAGGPGVATDTGRLIGDMGRQALNELRQVLGVLRLDDGEQQVPLSPQPTPEDLATLVEESRAAGMQITFDVIGEPSATDSTVQPTLYRVIQEGLTNAHKHAGNVPARVEVRYRKDTVRVIVENEAPAGPVPTLLPSGGHGLVGLGERVTVLGGTFEAGALENGGFRITATVPLR